MMWKKSEARAVGVGSFNIWSIGKDTHERKILGNLRKMSFVRRRKWKSFIIGIRYAHLSPIMSVLSLNLISLTPDFMMRPRILWAKVLYHPNLLHPLMLSFHFHPNFWMTSFTLAVFPLPS
jgi:hypothetical protein